MGVCVCVCAYVCLSFSLGFQSLNDIEEQKGPWWPIGLYWLCFPVTTNNFSLEVLEVSFLFWHFHMCVSVIFFLLKMTPQLWQNEKCNFTKHTHQKVKIAQKRIWQCHILQLLIMQPLNYGYGAYAICTQSPTCQEHSWSHTSNCLLPWNLPGHVECGIPD